MKRKQLAISGEFLALMLGAGVHPAYECAKDAIPFDAKVMGSWHDSLQDVAHFVLYSEEFPDVPDGELIPELIPICKLVPGT